MSVFVFSSFRHLVVRHTVSRHHLRIPVVVLAAVLGLAVSSCSSGVAERGSGELETAPDLVCADLAEARGKLTRQNVSVEVQDATGDDRVVVFEDNWVVVDHDPVAGAPMEERVTLSVVMDQETTECGSGSNVTASQTAQSEEDSESLSAEPNTNTPVSQRDTEREGEPAKLAEPAEPTEHATAMPDLMCFDLQAAQDFMQEFTGDFFAVNSKDASGEYRLQIIDRNWVVVDQEPLPGEPLVDTPTVLVLKDDEVSDC